MTKCPQCDYDAIWVNDMSFCVEFDGTRRPMVFPRKIPAFCNTIECDQRYWYYPETGRITKRQIGPYSPYLHYFDQKKREEHRVRTSV